MITNILAAVVVTLVTNVTEIPIEYEPVVSAPYIITPEGDLTRSPQGTSALIVKDVTTTIEKITTLTFDWNGVTRKVETSETVSETSVRYRRDWRQVPPPLKTNAWCDALSKETNGYTIVFTNQSTLPYVVEGPTNK